MSKSESGTEAALPSEIANVFNAWPDPARDRALGLRGQIFAIADDIRKTHNLKKPLEETLKWGEPAYILSTGSTLRMGHKAARPDTLSLYFNCNTRLVETFRELHGERLDLVGSRELSLPIAGDWPDDIVADCIRKTLAYHTLKKLDLLGG